MTLINEHFSYKKQKKHVKQPLTVIDILMNSTFPTKPTISSNPPNSPVSTIPTIPTSDTSDVETETNQQSEIFRILQNKIFTSYSSISTNKLLSKIGKDSQLSS